MTDQPSHEQGPSYPSQPPQQPPYGYGYGQPAPYPAQPPLQVAPKSPALALLASFFIPGLGTMMNGEAGKGIAILVGYAISWVLLIVLVGIIGVLGFWVWGMVDAYQGAQRWNLRHGILS